MNRFPRHTERVARPVTIPLLLAACIIVLTICYWLLHQATGYSIIPTQFVPAAHVEKETWA